MNPSTPPRRSPTAARSGADRCAYTHGNPSPVKRAALGYRFAAVPTQLLDAIKADKALPAPSPDLPELERRRLRNDRLRDVDAVVMGELLGFRRCARTSVWCSKQTIADRIGMTTRTVQMSLRRLELHGFIEQVPVDVPDPDEPSNRTGWRIVLLFMPGARRQGLGPDRRRPEERRGPAPRLLIRPVSSPPTPSEQAAPALVSTARKKPVSSRPRKPISSKNRAGALESQDKPQLDESTPFPHETALQVPSAHPEQDDESCASVWGARREAVETVRELLGAEVARQVDTDRFGAKIGGRWDCLHAAAHMTKAKRGRAIEAPVGWLLAVAQDYAARGDGIPPEVERLRQGRLEAKRRNEEARRALKARAESAGTPESDEVSIEQLRQWATGPDRALRRFARVALAQAGVLVPVDPPAAAARTEANVDGLTGDRKSAPHQPDQARATAALSASELHGVLAATPAPEIDRDLSRRHGGVVSREPQQPGGLLEDRQKLVVVNGTRHWARAPGPGGEGGPGKVPDRGRRVSAGRGARSPWVEALARQLGSV